MNVAKALLTVMLALNIAAVFGALLALLEEWLEGQEDHERKEDDDG